MSITLQLVPITSTSQIAAVSRMAREIWEEHYIPLIGRAQVDYMVAKFQSAEAIRAQIDSGYVAAQTAYITKTISRISSEQGDLGAAVSAYMTAVQSAADRAAALSGKN